MGRVKERGRGARCMLCEAPPTITYFFAVDAPFCLSLAVLRINFLAGFYLMSARFLVTLRPRAPACLTSSSGDVVETALLFFFFRFFLLSSGRG